MDPLEARETGFGTTAEEWALLQLAYNLALAISQGQTPPEQLVAKFRAQDERSNLMFEDWWKTRTRF